MANLPGFTTNFPAGYPTFQTGRGGTFARGSTSSGGSPSVPNASSEPHFDIFDWHPAYQSCQRYFLDHAQHDTGRLRPHQHPPAIPMDTKSPHERIRAAAALVGRCCLQHALAPPGSCHQFARPAGPGMGVPCALHSTSRHHRNGQSRNHARLFRRGLEEGSRPNARV